MGRKGFWRFDIGPVRWIYAGDRVLHVDFGEGHTCCELRYLTLVYNRQGGGVWRRQGVDEWMNEGCLQAMMCADTSFQRVGVVSRKCMLWVWRWGG